MTRGMGDLLRVALEAVSHKEPDLAAQRVPRQYAHAVAQLARASNSFCPTPSVVGYGIGPKITAGQKQRRPALRFYVARKKPLDLLGSATPVPPRLRLLQSGPSIITDVLDLGRISLQDTRARARPASPGSSIGVAPATTGTLGGLLSIGEQQLLVSCRHVIAPYKQCGACAVLQPGPLDHTPDAASVIGTLRCVASLKPGIGFPNLVDAAAATPVEVDVATNMLPDGTAIGSPTFARRGWPVQLRGRTSGIARGSVVDTAFRFAVRMDGKRYGFDRQILCTKMSHTGDSGALLRTTHNRVLGMLVAGARAGSVFSPIRFVIRELSREL